MIPFPPNLWRDTLQAGPPPVRFGPYEVNLDSGDLRKFGYRVRLQPKSFLVLRSLLVRPGELVTREELKAQLWPENTFVEFESSLNVAVRRLREALGDEAQHPVYIETVPRHGYRFVGVLEPSAAEECIPEKAFSPAWTGNGSRVPLKGSTLSTVPRIPPASAQKAAAWKFLEDADPGIGASGFGRCHRQGS